MIPQIDAGAGAINRCTQILLLLFNYLLVKVK